mgnify:CR=1 FL=1
MEVLLAGNTGYVTETFIEESFPECDVVVLGNEMLKSNRKKNILSRPFIKDEKELKEIFETYEFERIVYFSNYLTMHGRMTGELDGKEAVEDSVMYYAVGGSDDEKHI